MTNDKNEGVTPSRQQVRMLQHELARREAELLRAERAAAENARAIESLTQALAGAHARTQELEAKLAAAEARIGELERRLDSAAKDIDAELIDFGVTLAREDRAEAPGEAVELLPPEAIIGSDDDVAPVVHARGADRKLVGTINGEDVDYPLDKQHITIGRARSSDIRITSQFISRIHARISTHGIATVIEDVGSKNGIRVNRERVQRCVLKDGDVVSLGGELELKFVDARP